MIIEKLEIKNFGKIQNRTIELHKGINMIHGENEWGKSTTHGFIRAMFFGIERLRGKGAKTDTYNRYEPWDNPTYFCGAMEFTCGGKRFRLERNFYKETQSATLVNVEDGEHLSVEHGDLDVLLGGINQGIFDNTVSVGQLKSVTGRELAEELKNYIANYQGGADEDINPNEAIEVLKEQRKETLLEKKLQQEQSDTSLREFQTKLDLLQSQQRDCEIKMQEIQRQLESCEPVTKPVADTASSGTGKVEKLWKCITLSWVIITLIASALAIIFRGRDLSIVFLVMAIAAGIQIPVSYFIRKWIMKKLSAGKKDTAKEVEKSEDLSAQLKGKQQLLQEEYQERGIIIENLLQEKEELEDSRYSPSQLDEELSAIDLAMSTLQETVTGMQKGIGSRLRSRMSEILSYITEGKYTNVVIDENMDIRIQTIHRQIELYQLSRGTLEQVYFALRMAAAEILCGQEPMPVILDDVFVMYDEKRKAKALEWLEEHEEQAIIFSCVS